MTISKKNILHVIGSAGFGGGERYLLDLIYFSLKHCSHVAAVPHAGPLTRQMKSVGNQYRIINMPRFPSVTSIIRLCRLCQHAEADIIHSHGFRANLYGRLAAFFCRKPHVATIHVSLYDYLETPAVIRRFYQFIEKRSAWLTRQFICVSEDMARDTRAIGIKPERIEIIENGVDPERFDTKRDVNGIKQKFEIQDRQPVIGTVGRLVPEKGQASLIKALSVLKVDFPDLICLFVGEGPLLHSLQETAQKADVFDICRFTGPVENISEIYAMLDLFVLPSLREPFGLAALEAMASGVAVLATNAGGPLTYIRDGVNGMLVPPAEPVAMAEGIREILSDSSLRITMADAGKRTVVERFDIRKMVERVTGIYSSL